MVVSSLYLSGNQLTDIAANCSTLASLTYDCVLCFVSVDQAGWRLRWCICLCVFLNVYVCVFADKILWLVSIAFAIVVLTLRRLLDISKNAFTLVPSTIATLTNLR